ncbi:MAG TPA: chlororespiratory reduction protein 7 [Cyanobacteria bacterium UBA11149]|nr:chlororespiratory reduction protein 7 [Cyanobacteria bacterium UBA11367]HBE57009.1 chlororespiratory reduction protein 7 [Cyanobacteria bacterium UBA11366]HBK66736.1 chlororespiratory reduction protein 7 [Cyanobacteria bacterium UBA11166]HBR73061.1 chlororespiratory reduction protein 7 [Cyanobacteria bacterium UBA11159]HBS72724.1 chlororespiratory reduction protein 7 [Cyanobacteria bacterium UBA11153]HBW88846.1 chlororespiratory reduction protein 7 [Cyanobacteria bacterium UBA11149]HCA9700
MRDSIMYQEDAYVVLETNQPEQFFTPEELLTKLQGILVTRQDELPRDLQKFATVEAQAKYLMETSCELDVGAGEYLQWYVVRLEK